MEILTEFDELQNAMTKINLDESVFPYHNGRLVQDDVAYNKIQKILNCPEMVSCHKYLYNLDLDQLNEDEVDKVEKLYKLGCDRGFITDDLTDWDAETSIDSAVDGIVNATKSNDEVADEKVDKPKSVSGTLFKAKIPCWTIIYSATSKDGQIKTGEAYSNAISADAAKADVKSKLSNVGYSNITILAIESCEADVEASSFNDEAAAISEADDDAEEETEEETKEETEEETSDGDSNDDSSDDSSDDDSSDDSSDDDSSDDSSKEDSSDDSDEEESDEKSDEDSSDDSDEEEKSDNEEDSDDEESDDDSSDEDSDEDSDDEELDANKKAELKDKYKKTFKNTLVKCKFTKSFNDLSLEEKVKFFTQLSKAWSKNEPNEFMTDKEMEQLNNIVVNPDGDED